MKDIPIVIVLNTLKNGGAEKQALLLSEVLTKSYSISIIVYDGNATDNKLLEIARNLNGNLYLLEGNMFYKIFVIYKIFRKNKRGIVFSYLAKGNFINAIVGEFAKVKFKIGGIRSSLLTNNKLLLQKFLHNYLLDYTIVNSASGYLYLKNRGFNTNCLILIPNGIRVQRQNRIFNKYKKTINILSVGRFVEAKDFPTAINAIAILKERTNITYTIVGYGILEFHLKNLIEEYRLESVVELIINPPNLHAYYESADIFLSTSIFEGFSNSIMEAMEYSLPVVATDVGDNEFLIRNNHNGFLTKKKDPTKIAEKLEILIENVELRMKMGANSYNRLIENYGIETFEKNYLDLIIQIETE